MFIKVVSSSPQQKLQPPVNWLLEACKNDHWIEVHFVELQTTVDILKLKVMPNQLDLFCLATKELLSADPCNR